MKRKVQNDRKKYQSRSALLTNSSAKDNVAKSDTESGKTTNFRIENGYFIFKKKNSKTEI